MPCRGSLISTVKRLANHVMSSTGQTPTTLLVCCNVQYRADAHYTAGVLTGQTPTTLLVCCNVQYRADAHYTAGVLDRAVARLADEPVAMVK
ncbi:hypothetical protein ACOMHN_060456 [Nucella lapillus]